ncbi:MAG TPA: DUF6603 domain-containing protein [Steroidobacteraceae bacterium]|nr:DUF6603 domain-containing protein [Steroidobacteraceae bacterium]
MSANSMLQDLLGELAELHGMARDMLSDDITRKAIIRDLGGDPSATAPAPQFPPSSLQSVEAYRNASEPGLEALLEALQDLRSFHEALQGFAESLNLGPDAIVEDSYRLILDVLGWNLVRLRYPRLYFIMQIVSFAEDITSPFPGEVDKHVPFPSALDRLLSALIFELPEFWKRGGFESVEALQRRSDVIAIGSLAGVKIGGLIPGVKKVTKEIPGDNVIYGLDAVPSVVPSDPPTPAADLTQARMFTINFVDSNKKKIDEGTETTALGGNFVTSLALVPETQGGPGIFAAFGGGADIATRISTHWYLNAEVQCAGAVSALLTSKPKPQFTFVGPKEASDFRAVVALEARPDPTSATGKAFNFPIATGTGLAAEQVRVEGTMTQDAVQLRLQMLGAVATLSPDSFDNFIAKILPKDGLRVDFDLGVGLASDRGTFHEGAIRSAGTGGTARPTTPPAPGVEPPPLPPLPPESGPGFGLTIPIGKSLGPLTLHNLQLRFGSEDVEGKKTYLIQAASSISTKLGPVMARVDRAGLKFGVHIVDKDKGETGNLGFADIDVGAVLPNGVSLAIDAKGVVSGGGFLFHDKVQEVYAGVMQLSLKERITVKAFGLIATKMPDGSKGFSLIVFITAEDFQPIPIGMGATLQGIGGMIAINRTFNEEAMRAGLRNKTLGTLLFPKDPIRNAPEIIRNLITTFPAEEGCYLIGVLMKIGWFSPTLVYLDIGIMVELGKRMRLIVLGMISALLPTRENDLVRLNMDALGLVDMGALNVAVDAVLVDSRLAHKFVLTGEMALRASMMPGRRNFVMAVGGFNPRFAPPENFPTLKRITIALASGNNPRLTCEAYFAITSNTIQFGARAELYAAAFGFSIEGDVGFDVLIHLLPFHLIADFKASVQLKRGSRSLFKLSVSGTLEGPRPLRISGKASFEIFWCDFTIRFDKTLISGDKPPLPPAVDVLTELRRVLTVPDAWSTQIAQNRQHGVTLRKIAPGTTLVLDPLGNLVVKQTIVPLNTSRDLDTFGGAPVAGARRFRLEASIEGVTQDVNTVQDAFAPGQFFDMTDDEKLASPSFEDMDAGAIFGSDAIVIDEAASLFAPLEYETIIIDEEGQATNEKEDRYVLVAHRFFEQVRFSAVGTAPIRSIGVARFRNREVPAAVTMRTSQFVIASVADGIVPPTAKPATFAETQATLSRLNRGLAGEAVWQILPVHETAG